MNEPCIAVSVVYALPQQQWVLELRLPAGSRVRDAMAAAATGIPDLHLEELQPGVFGRVVEPDTTLADGDRVELLRPLLCDPKDVRRQRAGTTPRRT